MIIYRIYVPVKPKVRRNNHNDKITYHNLYRKAPPIQPLANYQFWGINPKGQFHKQFQDEKRGLIGKSHSSDNTKSVQLNEIVKLTKLLRWPKAGQYKNKSPELI
jgi:hypothetical protein